MKVEAVVLANGEYPTAPLPLQILADAPYVVCCDGGADEYIRNGHTPNLIIGDGDSISEENRKKYGHLLHRIAEQETNDQTKAVNYLLSQGKRRALFAFIIGLTAAAVSIPVRQKKNPMTYMFYGQIAIYLGLAFFTTWFSNPTTWFWLALTLMMYWFVGYRRKGKGSHGRK